MDNDELVGARVVGINNLECLLTVPPNNEDGVFEQSKKALLNVIFVQRKKIKLTK